MKNQRTHARSHIYADIGCIVGIISSPISPMHPSTESAWTKSAWYDAIAVARDRETISNRYVPIIFER